MAFFGNLFGRKLLTAAFTVAGLSLLSATASYADQFQYQFSGYADGTLQGIQGSDQYFTLTFDENTSAIDNRGGGYYSYDDVTALLSVDLENVILDNVTLVINSNSGYENVNFFNSNASDGLGLDDASQLLGYSLTSNVTVPLTSSNLTPTLNGGTFTIDPINGGGTVQFTAEEGLGFTATDLTPAAAPEPSSLLLLATGLPGLALLRRRFVKA